MIKRIVSILFVSLQLVVSISLAQDVIVYKETGKFCAWPANEGVWSWGNEILVGFNRAVYMYNPDGHSYNPAYPIETVQARSLDGGITWSFENPLEIESGDFVDSHRAMNFTHPDFAMKVRYRKLYYSYDRGKDWFGPFELPGFDQIAVRSRTDYIVESQSCAKFFVPVTKPDGTEDRPMVFETNNCGRTFDFVGWMAPCPEILPDQINFCTMPSTVKIAEDTYLSALRFRKISDKWLGIYKTVDGGKTWEFLSRPVEGQWNPASLIRLSNGNICLTYGWRYLPSRGIRAKISQDNGFTWGSEIIIRDDAIAWDIGYPRSVQREDGKIVTIYYIATDSIPQQHIAATIWQP